MPFTVAAGVTEVKVSYEWAQPAFAVDSHLRSTLDLGLRDPNGNRGWSGSGKGWPGAGLDVRGRPAGDGSDRSVRVGPDWATPSYVPGPIPPGEWQAEIGVAALALGQATTFTVHVSCSDAPSGPSFAAPTPPGDVVRAGPAWFAGDLHVHSNHSENYGRLERIVDLARANGLDFVSITDHNAVSQYAAFAPMRARQPDLLLLRGTEVTTYRGHVNVHGVPAPKDYRAGNVWRLALDGSRTLAATAITDNDVFRAARRAGGVASINHPSFPPDPAGHYVCRGCGWEFADTDDSLVDAIEVSTGPAGTTPAIAGAPEGIPLSDARLGPNPLTPPSVAFWLRAEVACACTIAAIGGSDDHTAGAGVSVTGSAIGTPTTMVYADELSERAILDGVRARHTYVKLWDSHGPTMRLVASNFAGEEAMMGDTLPTHGDGVGMHARAEGVKVGDMLALALNGLPIALAPADASGDAEIAADASTPGFYYAAVLSPDGPLLAVTSAIHVVEA